MSEGQWVSESEGGRESDEDRGERVDEVGDLRGDRALAEDGGDGAGRGLGLGAGGFQAGKPGDHLAMALQTHAVELVGISVIRPIAQFISSVASGAA